MKSGLGPTRLTGELSNCQALNFEGKLIEHNNKVKEHRKKCRSDTELFSESKLLGIDSQIGFRCERFG